MNVWTKLDNFLLNKIFIQVLILFLCLTPYIHKKVTSKEPFLIYLCSGSKKFSAGSTDVISSWSGHWLLKVNRDLCLLSALPPFKRGGGFWKSLKAHFPVSSRSCRYRGRTLVELGETETSPMHNTQTSYIRNNQAFYWNKSDFIKNITHYYNFVLYRY